VAAGILIVAIRIGGGVLWPRVLRWALVRSVLLVVIWILYYASLPLLSLATASVAVYTSPIFVVLVAGFFFGDRIGWRQWLAVLVGFIGVVVIARPGTDGFSWAVLLPLGAAVMYGFAMVITREKCQEDTGATLSLSLAVAMLITGVLGCAVLAILDPTPETSALYPFLLGPWVTMSLWDWGVIAFLGLLIALYGAGVARAYQIGTSSVVATFDYAYLISAAVWGFVLFSEVPDGFTIAGMALITCAGLLALKKNGA